MLIILDISSTCNNNYHQTKTRMIPNQEMNELPLNNEKSRYNCQENLKKKFKNIELGNFPLKFSILKICDVNLH
jgi:hypothetical protein